MDTYLKLDMDVMLLISLLNDKRMDEKVISYNPNFNTSSMTNESSSNIAISNGAEKLADLSRETCTKRLAELSKGISHPVRVEIVRMLSQKPRDARFVCGDIVDSFLLAQSSVSQHLKVLKDTGWIQGEIDGPCVCYCIVEDIIKYYTALTEQCLKKNKINKSTHSI